MGSMYRKGFGSNLENLRQDVGSLADELSTLLSDKSDMASSDVKQRVQKIREDIEGVMTETTSKGRELIEQANLDGLTDSISNTVRERPFTMLAIAAGLGMVVASQMRR
jgi:ElaB/YqjD/DUF883 family membrane-anchored ribosome-binding protein